MLSPVLPPSRIHHPCDFGRVVVLYGGCSSEREISLSSGIGVLAALRRKGVDAHGIDCDAQGIRRMLRGDFDRAFIALHGRGGEDGTVQGALESMGIPFTGSKVLGSALSMDKYLSKRMWSATGIPTPSFEIVDADEPLDALPERIGFPMAIKPVGEGSSIGVSKVRDVAGLERAVMTAKAFDDRIIAESWIGEAEYTAAILEGCVLPLIRLETPHDFYDYEAKYTTGAGTRYFCPSGLDDRTEAEFGRLALDAFTVLGASGWGRVDFVCDRKGAPFFLDVNTIPGMTGHSLVPRAARAIKVGYDDLVWRILETSVE
ncbi:D-alanine--D-alanine ligase [Thioalkalivibrio sp. HK1]|uniref:D-alanine--D-alanine ligase n=1 Tax=Thioalkalivibrio sp. HK1 TaxID=1469245 RepID=UPI0018CC4A33|nr:D-alanine--D-alanine ligase [Thioalkalivibrio sp. HK1]